MGVPRIFSRGGQNLFQGGSSGYPGGVKAKNYGNFSVFIAFLTHFFPNFGLKTHVFPNFSQKFPIWPSQGGSSDPPAPPLWTPM